MTIKRSSWSIPYLIFLLIFVVLPLVLIAIYAFQDGEGKFTFANIARFFTDADSLSTFALSLEVAIENTAICLLLGYPAAYILASKDLNRSAVTVILFILPMWINALMRTLATAELFKHPRCPVGIIYFVRIIEHGVWERHVLPGECRVKSFQIVNHGIAVEMVYHQAFAAGSCIIIRFSIITHSWIR